MRAEKPSDLLDPDLLLRRPGARLLVLAPHPDDESLAAGGLIQRALAYGAAVGVAYATDGENNPWPQRALEHRLWVGPRQRTAWGARRRTEAEAALAALGAQGVTVHHLGWPDGGITWRMLNAMPAMLATLRSLIESARPTLLVLPDLADRHPDHSALHVLVDLTLRALPAAAQPVCLGYILHGRSHPGLPRRAVLALSADELARKRTAIRAHASQMALASRRMLRNAAATEPFVAGLRPHADAAAYLPWLPARGLRPALRLLVVDAEGGESVALGRGPAANLRWRDGSPAARTTRDYASPRYCKLYCALPSPWIFDGWGWCCLVA
ncbi:MAG TPA: PIG-L family deacetylase [Rhodanobacteraceae bacterium]